MQAVACTVCFVHTNHESHRCPEAMRIASCKIPLCWVIRQGLPAGNAGMRTARHVTAPPRAALCAVSTAKLELHLPLAITVPVADAALSARRQTRGRAAESGHVWSLHCCASKISRPPEPAGRAWVCSIDVISLCGCAPARFVFCSFRLPQIGLGGSQRTALGRLCELITMVAIHTLIHTHCGSQGTLPSYRVCHTCIHAYTHTAVQGTCSLCSEAVRM